jgi:hypothetical protein
LLPTFIVIGAMKAGTVTLRHHLDDHPHVFLARGGQWGEPNFFLTKGGNWDRGPTWYESLFDGSERSAARGECSPSYTAGAPSPDVAERMASTVPDVKLVYVVRHPIERMRSMYLHQVSAGRERRPVAEALRDPHYLDPSRYAAQLESFLRHVDRAQVLVQTSERMRGDPDAALRPVWSHIGVDLPSRVPHYADHTSADKRISRLHGRLRWLRSGFKENVPPNRRPDQRRGFLGAISTRRPRPADAAVPRDLRRELWERLGPDLEQLRSLVGDAEFASWGWSPEAPTNDSGVIATPPRHTGPINRHR